MFLRPSSQRSRAHGDRSPEVEASQAARHRRSLPVGMLLGVVALAVALWVGVGAVMADPPPTVRFTSAPSGTVATRYYFLTFVAEPLDWGMYISRDGGPWSDCLCGLTGFGYAAGQFDDGHHTFSVRVGPEAAGNPIATASWTVDTQLRVEFFASTSGTVATSVAAFSYTAQSISGLAQGHGFECRIDGQVVGSSAYVAAGAGYCVKGPLDDGPHRVDITPLTVNGVPEGPPTSRTWIVDTNASQPSLDVTFISAPDGPIHVPIVAVTFGAPLASAIECRKDPAPTDPWAFCGSGGGYGGSIVLDGLTTGRHVLEVRARGADGQTGAVATLSIDVAPPPPLVAVTTPTGSIPPNPDRYGYQAAVVVEALPFATVECRFDPSDPADQADDPLHPWFTSQHCGDIGVFIPGDLGPGAHTVQFRQRNYVGSVSASTIVPFALGLPDSIPPITRISSGPEQRTTSTTAVLGYASTEFGASAFSCTLSKDGTRVLPDPVCTPDGSATLAGLAPGTYSFSVYATDASGNIDTVGATRSWEVLPPASLDIAINGPASLVNIGAAHLSFFLTSAVDGATFECRLTRPGGAPAPSPSLAPGATPGPGQAFAPCWSPVDYTGLGDGSHAFEVRATDSNGTVGPTANVSWTVDVAAPTVTIDQAATQTDPTTADTVHFTVVFSEPVMGFTADDLDLGGTATDFATATITGSGATYDVAVTGLRPDGSVIASVLAAAAVDAAGNASAASTSTDNSVAWIVAGAVGPTATVYAAGGLLGPTSASPIYFMVVFSEPVYGFTTGDVALGGDSGATSATVSMLGNYHLPWYGTRYQVVVGGMTNSGTLIISLPAGVATDAAGNPSQAATSADGPVIWTYPTPPAVRDFVPATNSIPATQHSIGFSLTFDRALDGLVPSDLTIGGSSTGWTVSSVTLTSDQENGPEGIATDGTYVYVADTNNARIVKRLASDLSIVTTAGTYGSGPGQFSRPHGIATDGTYVFVSDPTDHRLTKWRASDLGYVSSIGTIGTAGTGIDQFHGPLGMVTKGGYLYVADTGNNRIVKRLASDLSYVAEVPAIAPFAIATDGTSFYVASGSGWLERRDGDLGLLQTLGAAGSGQDEFAFPEGIATDGTYVYVADSANNRVMKRLATDLSYVAQVGTQGYGDDEFNGPYGIATDGTTLWVADTFNNRNHIRRTSDLGFVGTRPGDFYAVVLTASDPTPGTLTLAVNANSAKDGMNLSNTGPVAAALASPVVQVHAANAPAVVSFSPPTTAIPVGMYGLPYTLTFDQPVAGLAESDFSVGGTSPGWFVASTLPDTAANDQYTVFLSATSPMAPGTLTLTLNADSVTAATVVTTGPSAAVVADATVQVTSGAAVGTGYTPRGADVAVVPAFGGAVSPVTVYFGVVDTTGTTTLTLDPNPALPSDSQLLGGFAFDLSTTATVHSRILVCVNYHGIATSAPSVLHYEGGAWKDITTDVDPAGEVVCGTTTSLSPFAIAHPTPTVVQSSGTQLTFDGQPYRPIGLNIYNANSNDWCRYAMDGTLLDESLTAIGTGPNAMRAWFFQPLAMSGSSRDWTAFDRTLATAKAHGYRVIATLGDQWGDCGDRTGHGYGYKNTQWYQSAYRDADPAAVISYRDWVAEVVLHYRNDPTILAWQLMNEPEVNSGKDADCTLVPESTATNLLRAFATDVSGLVRSIDSNHLISLGLLGGGQCGTQGDDYATVMSIPTLDLCEYHDYTPTALVPGDQWNGLQRRIDQCNALHKPLIVGELGVKPNAVGGTLADRAHVVAAKACAQLSAGVAGMLLWNWDQQGGSSLTDYDIGPNDPVLDALAPWSDPAHTCTSPSSPRLFVAAAGDGSASLDWAAPASDGGSPLTGYRVTVSNGEVLPFAAGTTKATVVGLTNGTSYTFDVSASNDVESSLSVSSSPVTPRAGAQGAVKAVPSSGGSASTDPGSGPTATDPLTTGVTVPAGAGGGTLAITEGPATGSPLTGYTFLGQQVEILSTASTSQTDPLSIVFTLDGSAIRDFYGLAPTDPLPAPSGIDVTRDEGRGPVVVTSCTSTGGSGAAIAPDPCVATRAFVNGGTDLELTVLTGSASQWSIVARIRQAQAITFANPGSRTMLESPLTVGATATSGLPVTFTTTTPLVCTAGGTDGEAITFAAAGSCSVTANQAGGGVFDAAAPVTQSFAVSKVGQTVTFLNPGNKTLAQSPLAVSPMASSGLEVQLTTITPLVCTADGTNGASITFLTTGTCTVRADQPGNATWNPAAPVSRSFTVSKASQTITFMSPGNKSLAQSPLTISAIASSGLPVTVTSTTTSVCTVSATTVTLVTTGSCSLVASQAGSAVYNPATSVARSFTVSKASQTITFTSPGAKTMLQSPLTLSANASSGLPVTFTTSTPLVCTADGTLGSTITLLVPGTCTVTADQGGDDVYNPATPVSRGFTVSKASQTITFISPGNRTMLQTPVSVSGTSTSGLAVVFTTTTPLVCSVDGTDGTTISLVAPGTCTVKADQVGSDEYKPASTVSRNFKVSKVAQTITFTALASQLLATGSMTVSATASSGLTVSFATTTPSVCTAGGPDGTGITFLAKGTCTVKATQTGSTTYNAAPVVSRSFSIR